MLTHCADAGAEPTPPDLHAVPRKALTLRLCELPMGLISIQPRGRLSELLAAVTCPGCVTERLRLWPGSLLVTRHARQYCSQLHCASCSCVDKTVAAPLLDADTHACSYPQPQ